MATAQCDGAVLLLVLGGCLAGACAPYANLAVAAAARARCAPEDVVLSDVEVHNGYREWAMACKDEIWRCGGSSVGNATCERVASPLAATESKKPPPEASPRAPTWVSYESESCGVRVEFPGEPVTARADVPTKGGRAPVETSTFEQAGASGAMAVICATLGATDATQAALIDAGRDGMLGGIDARLIDESPIIGGKQLRFSVRNHEARARMMIKGNKLLTMLVMPVDAFPEANVRRFLDSVHVQ